MANIPRLAGHPFVGKNTKAGFGNKFYVHNASGNDSAGVYGKDPRTPFATLAYALNFCQDGNGDVIYLLDGHAETISAAISIGVAGLSIIGLGTGDQRPTFTFATSTDAGFTLAAADIEITGCLGVCNIASQTRMVAIGAAGDGAHIHGNAFREGSETGLSFIELTGVANDVVIENNRFYAPTAGNYDNAIGIDAAAARLTIRNNYIFGDFDDAGIHNPTGNVATQVLIEGNNVTNLQAGDHAIELVSAVTGMASNNQLSTDAYATAFDPGALRCNGNQWAAASGVTDQGGINVPATVDVADNYIGTNNNNNAADTSSVVANADGSVLERQEWVQAEVVTLTEKVDGGAALLGVKVNKDAETLPETDIQNIFTVSGGRVLVTLLTGEVTTVIESQACNLSVGLDATAGGDVTLASVLDINGFVLGRLFLVEGDGTALVSNGGATLTGIGLAPFVVSEGSIFIETSATNTGATSWELWYIPLDAGASVASA